MGSRKKKSYGIWDYLFSGGIALMFVLIAGVNLFHYCYKMNADIASEAVFAQLIWESGEWIPSSWYPSTELRILGTPNLASLFYAITKNMNLAMGIACTVMTAGILLSGYFFISQFSFDRIQKLAFLLLCLIIPNHFVTLELVYLMAGYYAVHVIILFFAMGVYARMINGKTVNILCWSAIVFLSFVMGMQGMRGILILGGPLMVTETTRQFYSVFVHKWKEKRSLMTCGWCFFVLLAGYAGTCMPFSVGQEGLSRNIRRGLHKLWETVIPDVSACLGWAETGIWGKAIILMLLSAGVLGLIYSVKQIFTQSHISNDTWIYLMLWCSPIITMLLAAFTTVESSERYYFIFLYALAFGWVCLLQRIVGCSKILRGGVYGNIAPADITDSICLSADHEK